MKYNSGKVITNRIIGLITWIVGLASLFYGIYGLINTFILFAGKKLVITGLDYSLLKLVVLPFVLLIAGANLNAYGKSRLSAVKEYKSYYNILSVDPGHSLAKLAASLNIPVLEANKDSYLRGKIINLINAGFFPKGTHIDPERNCLIIPGIDAAAAFTAAAAAIMSGGQANQGQAGQPGGQPGQQQDGTQASVQPVEYATAVCKGCGATNKIIKGSDAECEYCGSHNFRM